jgi:hypothetical protein
VSQPAAAAPAQQDAVPAPTPVRRSAWIEAVIVCGLALFMVFEVIPAQTTPGDAAAGLAPATLPTACVLAIAALALINLVVILIRGRSQDRGLQALSESAPDAAAPPVGTSEAADASAWPVLKMMLVSLAGVIALAYGGPKACAVVIVPLGMLALGERRIGRILPVTLLALAPFVLLFR